MTYPRSAAGARAFTSLLRERKISKRYIALVDGEVSEQGVWRDTISRNGVSLTSAISEKGEHAAASMLPLLIYGGRSLILVQLHTGLTHQIRVQASSRGCALSGDSKYGAEPFSGGYILHAVLTAYSPSLLSPTCLVRSARHYREIPPRASRCFSERAP